MQGTSQTLSGYADKTNDDARQSYSSRASRTKRSFTRSFPGVERDQLPAGLTDEVDVGAGVRGLGGTTPGYGGLCVLIKPPDMLVNAQSSAGEKRDELGTDHEEKDGDSSPQTGTEEVGTVVIAAVPRLSARQGQVGDLRFAELDDRLGRVERRRRRAVSMGAQGQDERFQDLLHMM